MQSFQNFKQWIISGAQYLVRFIPTSALRGIKLVARLTYPFILWKIFDFSAAIVNYGVNLLRDIILGTTNNFLIHNLLHILLIVSIVEQVNIAILISSTLYNFIFPPLGFNVMIPFRLNFRDIFEFVMKAPQLINDVRIILQNRNKWELSEEHKIRLEKIMEETDDFWQNVREEIRIRMSNNFATVNEPGQQIAEDANYLRLRCPITQRVMRDPVAIVAEKGKLIYYERLALQHWCAAAFQNYRIPRCPVTRIRITSLEQLLPADELKYEIAQRKNNTYRQPEGSPISPRSSLVDLPIPNRAQRSWSLVVSSALQVVGEKAATLFNRFEERFSPNTISARLSPRVSPETI